LETVGSGGIFIGRRAAKDCSFRGAGGMEGKKNKFSDPFPSTALLTYSMEQSPSSQANQ